MLSEILNSLSEGRTLSQHDLAARLNATPDAIAARLEFLHRAGYLRKVCAAEGDCGKKCAGCSGGNAVSGAVPVIWEAVR
jgi:hypothetical protein